MGFGCYAEVKGVYAETSEQGLAVGVNLRRRSILVPGIRYFSKNV